MMLLFFVVSLLGFTSTSANVIGIDFGSDNIKIGMIGPGKFDIVTNFQSKRRTQNTIAFYQGERSYGSDAYALMARKPEVVFSKFFRIIGKSTSSPRLTELVKQYFPYQVFTNESNHLTSIKFEDGSYTPEELLAMMMTHIKDITKEYSGAPVRDCVITVPASFTQHEKNALHAAAEIADMNVLSLIEENTAAALHFGIDRTFNEPHNVLFYNMGSGMTQVSVVTYSVVNTKEGSKNKSTGQFQVVGKAWDEEIGGFNFDLLVADLLATRFNQNWQKKKSGIDKDVRDFSRPMTRLRMDALKIREILSANNEYPYKVEQLHADVDLSTKITRHEFEELSRDLLQRITQPIDRALAMANLSLKDIHAVELLGGSVRMPAVKHILETYFKAGDLELGQHLNGDEAMALGATFRAANISTAYRVRKVGITDLLPFGVSVKFDNLPVVEETGGLMNWLLGNNKPKPTEGTTDEAEAWSKHTPLFPAGSTIPSKTKTVAFHHDKNILCRIEYDQNDPTWPLPLGTEPLIAVFNISNITQFVKDTSSLGLGQPKIHLSFTLDHSGMVTISKAEATLDLPDNQNSTTSNTTTVESSESEVESNETKTTTDHSESSESSESTTESTSSTSDETKEKSSSSSSSSSTEKKDSKKNAKKDKKKEKKESVLRRSLIVSVSYEAVTPPIWSPELIRNAQNRLRALDAADSARKEKAAALNDLEGYVYKVRNRIRDEEDQFKVISTEEQREEIIALCDAVEEWLYDEGKNQEVSVYKGKQSSIKTKAEAIFKRFKEHTSRPEAVKKATHQLSAVKQLVGEWEETMPQITTEEKEKLLETVNRIQSWITDNTEAQSKLTAFEQPAFTSTEVQNQLKPLTAQLEKLLKKPKPAPSKNTTQTNSTTNSTTPETNSTTNSTNGETKEEEPETIRVHTEDPEPVEESDEL